MQAGVYFPFLSSCKQMNAFSSAPGEPEDCLLNKKHADLRLLISPGLEIETPPPKATPKKSEEFVTFV